MAVTPPAAPPPVAEAPARPPVTTPRPNPPAAATAPPATTPPTDNRVLTGPTTAAAERSVRDTIARANQNLARLNYPRLSADGRANVDQARRFIQQAEQALRERNVPFAATLADKAATLAAELTGR